MGIQNGHGYSGWTPEKQRFFRRFINLHLGIAWGVMVNNRDWANQTYHYFDLNAGCGINPETGDPGSPIIFLEEVRKKGISFCAEMIEIDWASYRQLFNILKDKSNVDVFYDDHNEHMKQYCKPGHTDRFGLVYTDPTGVVDLPIDMLARFARHWTKMDILIMVSGQAVKRVQKRWGRDGLEKRLGKINKKNWLVREPSSDGNQWTFLYGTGERAPLPTWRNEGFYNVKSKRGIEIMDVLNSTKDDFQSREQGTFNF